MSARVFSIPPGIPFVDSLAAGLLRRHGEDPLSLSDVLILLPTRRAARSLREAFLRATAGQPLLLPRMQAVGDVDAAELDFRATGVADVPPAIQPAARRFLLMRLIRRLPEFASPATAARLADALGQLFDELVIEGVEPARLASLAPQEFAEHWQRTLAFLAIVTEQWPAVLAERGVIDAIDRRDRLIRAQAAAWRDCPPTGPVYAAGSTGSVPATAELIATVARLPTGAAILPGLDRVLDDAAWSTLADTPTHPQHALHALLAGLGLSRDDVQDWQPDARDEAARARARLMSEALRPASTTDSWTRLSPIDPAALRGMLRLDAPTAEEEAAGIALLLREALETPGRTAALVTPDRALARRVQADLRRYGVEIDDSAGEPLRQTAPGAFLLLVARLFAEHWAPIPLLSLLKHPFARAGEPAGRFRRAARRLELAILRGPRPGPGPDGLRRALAEAGAAGRDLMPRVERFIELAGDCHALSLADEVSPPDLLRAQVALAEALARDEAGCALWRGPAGEALAEFVQSIIEAGAAAEPVSPTAWPDLLGVLMEGHDVRPPFGRHPRLFIWGPLEARMQQADLIVLGGLNEGSWPSDPSGDPWFSRPMRSALGLSSPDRFIGLAAHDFQQAASAPNVVLARANKAGGAETVPSRWLMRLESVLQGQRLSLPTAGATTILGWARGRDLPDGVRPAEPPTPRPPVELRPRRLSVTGIETWIRDPYAVFARHVLDLRALDQIDADPGAADRGTIVHAALDRFLRDVGGTWPADVHARMIRAGEAAFAAHLARPGVRAFWWPRFLRIADWFLRWEYARRAAGWRTVATEVSGSLLIEAPAGPFELRAKADRIDRLGDAYAVLDYKTGTVPSLKQVTSGLNPQLPLEAAILLHGRIGELPPLPATELAYLKLSGGREAGMFRSVDDRDVAELVEETLAALAAWIATFDDPATPYLSRPRPQFERVQGDYDHLARVKEWSATEAEE